MESSSGKRARANRIGGAITAATDEMFGCTAATNGMLGWTSPYCETTTGVRVTRYRSAMPAIIAAVTSGMSASTMRTASAET